MQHVTATLLTLGLILSATLTTDALGKLAANHNQTRLQG